MNPPTLVELTRHASTIPSLPEVVAYLMRTLNDDRADIDTLAHHINSDPAIVGRLLAAANSAASGLSTRIFSAKQAFMVLGADRVVSIILASALAYRYEVRGKAFDSYLLRQSLGTLPLRMARHSENALTVARYLQDHRQIDWVRYPGLDSHPQRERAKRYLPDGCGGMVACGIRGGVEAGRRFLDALELFGHMANLGDSRSLAIHPASTTHSQLTREERLAGGIEDGLIRLSVGLEDPRDLVEDLDRAFSAAR